ncbi:MAG: ABC transporter permease [Coriobacteriia bacterium]|nr:ABC transporter permease [Coriobacteriia bacterium]
MRFPDLMHETRASLLANKGRSALTILGIAIGITSVVVMASLITGFENWLEDSMGLGSARVITVTSQDSEHALSEDDADFLAQSIDNVSCALPQASTSQSVGSATSSSTSSSASSTSTTSSSSTAAASSSGSSSSDSSSSSSTTLQLTGVSSEYFSMQNISLIKGSAYQDNEENQLVIDENAVESIYGDSSYNPVGQTLTLGSESYTIVGVSESSQLLQGISGLCFGYVSYQNMCSVLLGTNQVDSIYTQATDDADVSYTAAQVEGALVARHNISYDEDGSQSAYSASTTESAQESLASFTTAFDALAALVAGIALSVGGIGIMNMMLTNVTERYREIGLRKSLGARPIDIKLQFLSESIALCLIGGLVGTLAGWGGAQALAQAIVNA